MNRIKRRVARVKRKTKETMIDLMINLDGEGKYKIKTTVPFLNHMLDLFSKHSLFDLQIKAKGDTEVDDHHTVEDIGITLGEAVLKALGDKKGIERFGSSFVPMDEVLAHVVIDISGRPRCELDYSKAYYRDYYRKDNLQKEIFDPQLIEEFFKAFSDNAKITIHIRIPKPGGIHHLFEAIFKAFGRALKEAVSYNPRIKSIPSTKGKL